MGNSSSFFQDTNPTPAGLQTVDGQMVSNVAAAAASAAAALVSQTSATASNTAAALSASAALTSQTASSASQSAAAVSQVAAAGSASGASSSAAAALVSQTSATASQSASASSATAASGSAGSAAGSASTATTQATNSSNSAAAALVSQTAAAGSASTASTNATNTAALLASFRNVMLGAFSTDALAQSFATTNSITLAAGVMYENTTENKFRIYSGSAWGDYDATAQSSQTAAALAATNAGASQTAAATSATNAASSATAASGSQSAASTSATASAGSASSASTSASTATTGATTATTQAGIATTQATNAAASASTASTASTNAQAYATGFTLGTVTSGPVAASITGSPGSQHLNLTLPAVAAPTASILGGVFSSTAAANQFATGVSLTGAVTYGTLSSANVTAALAYTPANLTGATFTGAVSATALTASNGLIQGTYGASTAGYEHLHFQTTDYSATMPWFFVKPQANGWQIGQWNGSSFYGPMSFNAGSFSFTGTATTNTGLNAIGLSLTSGQISIAYSATNIAAVWRNDGTNLYLLTAPNVSSAYGSLRPFQMNLTTGALNFDGTAAGTNFGGAVYVAGEVRVTGSGATITLRDRTTANFSQLYRGGDVTSIWDNTFGNVLNASPTGAITIPGTLTVTGGLQAPTVSVLGGVKAAPAASNAYQMTGISTAGVPTFSTDAVGFRNRLINGDMKVSQRGSSFSSGVSTNTYTVDRWMVNAAGAAITVAQVAGPIGFPNCVQMTGATGNTSCWISQRIESINISDLAATTVTLQANLQASAAQTVNWVAYYPTAKDNYAAYNTVASGSWSVTTSPLTFSVNIAIPTGAGNGLWILIIPQAGGPFTSGWLNVTGVQIESGSYVTPFEVRPYEVELARCQRYFETSYNTGVAPGSSGQTYQGDFVFLTPNNTYPPIGTIPFKVTKRAGPTIVGYNPSTGAVSTFWDYTTSAANGSLSVPSACVNSICDFYNTSASWTVGHIVGIHWTVSAEL